MNSFGPTQHWNYDVLETRYFYRVNLRGDIAILRGFRRAKDARAALLEHGFKAIAQIRATDAAGAEYLCDISAQSM